MKFGILNEVTIRRNNSSLKFCGCANEDVVHSVLQLHWGLCLVGVVCAGLERRARDLCKGVVAGSICAEGRDFHALLRLGNQLVA